MSLLAGFRDRVASIDSHAYGIAARREAHAAGRPKTVSLVAAHMQRWTERQAVRADQALLDLKRPDPSATSPWERAITAAREDIRTLIAEGEIAHDQITDNWIAEWAATDCD